MKVLALGLVASALVCAAPAAAAPTKITEFPVDPNAGAGVHKPMYIQPRSTDQTLWFTDTGTSAGVRQFSTQGELLTSFNAEAGNVKAPSADLGVEPDGSITWVSDESINATAGGGTVSRRPSGGGGAGANTDVTNTYTILPRQSADDTQLFTGFSKKSNAFCVFGAGSGCPAFSASRLTDLTLDGGNRVWVAQPEGDQIFRLDPTRKFRDLAVTLPAGTTPGRIALGADGNLWVAGFGDSSTPSANTKNRIVRVSPEGVQFSFALPSGQGPNDIAAGPDGALWFTELLSNRIGRLSPEGVYTSFAVPSAASNPHPYGITTGPDGNIWFTEQDGGKIGRLVPGDDKATAGNEMKLTGEADKTKPRLRGFRLSRRSFRAAKSGGSFRKPKASSSAKRKRRGKVGTKVGFRASEGSTVKFTVQRRASGRRSGGKCKAPKRSNRGRKRCTRYVKVRGSFKIAAVKGKNSFTFLGRMRHRALRPGRYRLTSKATDPSKNASKSAHTSFRIIR